MTSYSWAACKPGRLAQAGGGSASAQPATIGETAASSAADGGSLLPAKSRKLYIHKKFNLDER
jgi:hypothetical protein